MEKFRTLKIVIVLMMCATLAGMAVTAGAVNGIRTGTLTGVQPLAVGGTGAGSPGRGFNIPATGGPMIGGGQGAGGGVGTPYATGGPSRCVGNICTADWVGSSGPQIGGPGASGIPGTPTGTTGTGIGTGLNIPAGSGTQGRDYSEWYARCAGVAGPGNDPMCRLGSPQSPYSTGGPLAPGGQGVGGSSGTPLATGGQGTGGTSGNLLYQLRPGDPAIGGVQG